MFGAVSIVDEGDQGYSQARSQPEEWSNPYQPSTVSPPPLVAVQQPETGSSLPSWQDWLGRGRQTTQTLFTGVMDIFGRPTDRSGAPVIVQQQGMPLGVIVALAVGGVVVLGVVASQLKSRRSYAGYRRKSRSRR